MALTRRAVLAATGTGIAVTGCLGTGGGGTDGGAATVGVRTHADYGDVLVDHEGMTLYRFDADTKGAGASACSGGCLDAWPPLTVDGEPTDDGAVSAPLTTFERPDGSTQVAADGWPLYYFASDEAPGDAKGQGLQDVWWLVAPDGSKVTGATSSGRSY